MLAKGKVTRYAQAETRREEILFLYIPCLSRASVRPGEWTAENHQWDRGITAGNVNNTTTAQRATPANTQINSFCGTLFQ